MRKKRFEALLLSLVLALSPLSTMQVQAKNVSDDTKVKTVQNTGSMKVFPTLAGPSDAITIELNAAGGNTLRHLYISDAAGRIVASRTVEAGKNNVSVDGGRFRSGMYNFTLEENGRIVDNGKIIVR